MAIGGERKVVNFSSSLLEPYEVRRKCFDIYHSFRSNLQDADPRFDTSVVQVPREAQVLGVLG